MEPESDCTPALHTWSCSIDLDTGAPLSHLHDLGSWIAGVTAQRHLIVTGEKALQTGVAHAEETIQELTVMARTPQPQFDEDGDPTWSIPLATSVEYLPTG